MNDAGERGLRTVLQGASALLLINLYQAFSPWPMSPTQVQALSPILTILLTAMASILQNTAEAKGYIKPIFKSQSEPNK